MSNASTKKAVVDLDSHDAYSDIVDQTSVGKNEIVRKPGIEKAHSELLKKFDKKSPRIRALSSQGYTRSQIAEVMKIRYQHVRNVLITPLVGQMK